MMVSLTFRRATINDLALLQKWDEQPHVIESDPLSDWDWEEMLSVDPPWRELWIAEHGETPIGFLQIIDAQLEESHYWGEIGAGFRAIDIWIGEAHFCGQGHGSAVMHFAINRCFSYSETHSILLDPLESNIRAHKFYERLGLEFLENRWFGPDYSRVYILRRKKFESGK